MVVVSFVTMVWSVSTSTSMKAPTITTARPKIMAAGQRLVVVVTGGLGGEG
jgi:hypothetical protein